MFIRYIELYSMIAFSIYVVFALALSLAFLLLKLIKGKSIPWFKKFNAFSIALYLILAISGWFYFPLPSDEVMIKNFYEHEADFEKLIKTFIENPGDGDELLMEKLQVKKPVINSGLLIMDAGKKEKIIYIGEEYRENVSVRITPVDGMRTSFRYFRKVWKSYVHFPNKMNIHNGELIYLNGSRKRVIDNLDIYPKGFSTYECVFKQINDLWFLELCRA